MDLLTARIDLGAIAHNTREMARRVAPARLMAVVKADGYNHGAVEVARTALRHGARELGVATLDEALHLREQGIVAPITAWLWSPEQDIAEPLRQGVRLAVTSPVHARALIHVAQALPRRGAAMPPCEVTVKVETGMHRSGVDPRDWAEVFDLLAACPAVRVTGLMSHLSCADEPDNPATDAQAAQFGRAIACARERGLEVPVNHLCNSPGALTRPDLHHEMVRVGVALYGLEPVPGREHGLMPAMTWQASVLLVKPVRAGEATSYGLTWSAPSDGFLAVIPAGYADGLPRAAQGHLEVTIRGHRYPQVGRVCMDQCLVWLGENPRGIAPGDEAILFGQGGMSATELAQRSGTINYEVVCAPRRRTRRQYVEETAE
ncbi:MULTISPECIES: alanine racemase [unclassified Corynebacterium]|uniref:alanine racemase n=1 Tax=unclassified Corynebacterium TaxID=2624378 RepID=UPI0029C9CB2F|nr:MULTISPECIES: alanine racemase [unclassified Corynebacterium]WPF67236.1 alanine racemase [Corynebacterium sp. 22KM0430]WPF69725.1 alanine racemase [Corynebacterium sp. 21KM1197]